PQSRRSHLPRRADHRSHRQTRPNQGEPRRRAATTPRLCASRIHRAAQAAGRADGLGVVTGAGAVATAAAGMAARGSEVGVVDVTLRDGHQSLWATRMPTSMMLPIAERMDTMGFHAIDLMAAVTFDVCVRYLHEDPWRRIRLMAERIRRTPLNGWVRSKSLISFDLVADDVIELWVKRLAANGLRRVTCFDAL